MIVLSIFGSTLGCRLGCQLADSLALLASSRTRPHSPHIHHHSHHLSHIHHHSHYSSHIHHHSHHSSPLANPLVCLLFLSTSPLHNHYPRSQLNFNREHVSLALGFPIEVFVRGPGLNIFFHHLLTFSYQCHGGILLC